VFNTPAGLVCHPTKTDEYSSLISRTRLYLGNGSHPQLVNRLDRETSGVTLIAKTETAARELRRIWEDRGVEKNYLALVHGIVREDHGIIEAPIGKDESSRVAIKDCVRPDGAPAQTEFWNYEKRGRADCPQPAWASDGAFSAAAMGWEVAVPSTLLMVRPQTGRKHQIRIHLAHLGHPIIGDKLYGGDENLYLDFVEYRLTPEQRQRLILPNHALHAAEVKFEWRGTERKFSANRVHNL
jgi:23S rRNA pseudouridine1911/1915/1917 synthase